MYQNDKICQRCGHPKVHHDKNSGAQLLKCIRKKPYKLRDGIDVKIGMRVWWVFAFGKEIRTGIVNNIFDFGVLNLRKDEKDKDPKMFCDSFWSPLPSAFHSCFSSLENAEKFQLKEKKRWKRL